MAAAVRTRLAHDGAPGTVLGEPLVGVGGPVPGGDGWGPRTIRYHGSFQCPAPPPPAPLRDAQAFQPGSFRWQQVGIGEPLPDSGRQTVPVHRACRGQERPGEQRLHRPDSGTRETRNIGEPHDHLGHRHVGDRRPARGAFPVDDQRAVGREDHVLRMQVPVQQHRRSARPCPASAMPPSLPPAYHPEPRKPPPSRAAGPVPTIPSHETPAQPGLSLPGRATKPPAQPGLSLPGRSTPPTLPGHPEPRPC